MLSIVIVSEHMGQTQHNTTKTNMICLHYLWVHGVCRCKFIHVTNPSYVLRLRTVSLNWLSLHELRGRPVAAHQVNVYMFEGPALESWDRKC